MKTMPDSELDPEDDPKGPPELKGHAAMLTKLAEAGKVTLVDWPMNTWCSQSSSEDMNCQVCENAGRQTGIINYHMNRYRDTSTFTTFGHVAAKRSRIASASAPLIPLQSAKPTERRLGPAMRSSAHRTISPVTRAS